MPNNRSKVKPSDYRNQHHTIGKNGSGVRPNKTLVDKIVDSAKVINAIGTSGYKPRSTRPSAPAVNLPNSYQMYGSNPLLQGKDKSSNSFGKPFSYLFDDKRTQYKGKAKDNIGNPRRRGLNGDPYATGSLGRSNKSEDGYVYRDSHTLDKYDQRMREFDFSTKGYKSNFNKVEIGDTGEYIYTNKRIVNPDGSAKDLVTGAILTPQEYVDAEIADYEQTYRFSEEFESYLEQFYNLCSGNYWQTMSSSEREKTIDGMMETADLYDKDAKAIIKNGAHYIKADAQMPHVSEEDYVLNTWLLEHGHYKDNGAWKRNKGDESEVPIYYDPEKDTYVKTGSYVKPSKEDYDAYIAQLETAWKLGLKYQTHYDEYEKDTTEKMKYTAGALKNTPDTLWDAVIRNGFKDLSSPDFATRDKFMYNMLVNAGKYFKNYVWNPFKKGDVSTLTMNGLTNFGEVLDYAAYGGRAIAATDVIKYSGDYTYTGQNVWTYSGGEGDFMYSDQTLGLVERYKDVKYKEILKELDQEAYETLVNQYGLSSSLKREDFESDEEYDEAVKKDVAKQAADIVKKYRSISRTQKKLMKLGAEAILDDNALMHSKEAVDAEEKIKKAGLWGEFERLRDEWTEHKKGVSALERVKKAYTDFDSDYLPDTGSLAEDSLLYFVTDPSVIATLGLSGVVNAGGKAVAKGATKQIEKDLVKEFAKEDIISEVFTKNRVALGRDIFTMSDTKLQKHAEKTVNDLIQSGVMPSGQKFDYVKKYKQALNEVQDNASYKVINSVRHLNNFVDKVDMAMLAGGLYMPASVLGVYKGTRKLLDNSKFYQDMVKANAFKKQQAAERAFNSVAGLDGGTSILDIGAYVDSKNLNIDETLSSSAFDTEVVKYYDKERATLRKYIDDVMNAKGVSPKVLRENANELIRKAFVSRTSGIVANDVKQLKEVLTNELNRISRSSGMLPAQNELEKTIKVVDDLQNILDLSEYKEKADWINRIEKAKDQEELQVIAEYYVHNIDDYSVEVEDYLKAVSDRLGGVSPEYTIENYIKAFKDILGKSPDSSAKFIPDASSSIDGNVSLPKNFYADASDQLKRITSDFITMMDKHSTDFEALSKIPSEERMGSNISALRYLLTDVPELNYLTSYLRKNTVEIDLKELYSKAIRARHALVKNYSKWTDNVADALTGNAKEFRKLIDDPTTADDFLFEGELDNIRNGIESDEVQRKVNRRYSEYVASRKEKKTKLLKEMKNDTSVEGFDNAFEQYKFTVGRFNKEHSAEAQQIIGYLNGMLPELRDLTEAVLDKTMHSYILYPSKAKAFLKVFNDEAVVNEVANVLSSDTHFGKIASIRDKIRAYKDAEPNDNERIIEVNQFIDDFCDQLDIAVANAECFNVVKSFCDNLMSDTTLNELEKLSVLECLFEFACNKSVKDCAVNLDNPGRFLEHTYSFIENCGHNTYLGLDNARTIMLSNSDDVDARAFWNKEHYESVADCKEKLEAVVEDDISSMLLQCVELDKSTVDILEKSNLEGDTIIIDMSTLGHNSNTDGIRSITARKFSGFRDTSDLATVLDDINGMSSSTFAYRPSEEELTEVSGEFLKDYYAKDPTKAGYSEYKLRAEFAKECHAVDNAFDSEGEMLQAFINHLGEYKNGKTKIVIYDPDDVYKDFFKNRINKFGVTSDYYGNLNKLFNDGLNMYDVLRNSNATKFQTKFSRKKKTIIRDHIAKLARELGELNDGQFFDLRKLDRSMQYVKDTLNNGAFEGALLTQFDPEYRSLFTDLPKAFASSYTEEALKNSLQRSTDLTSIHTYLGDIFQKDKIPYTRAQRDVDYGSDVYGNRLYDLYSSEDGKTVASSSTGKHAKQYGTDWDGKVYKRSGGGSKGKKNVKKYVTRTPQDDERYIDYATNTEYYRTYIPALNGCLESRRSTSADIRKFINDYQIHYLTKERKLAKGEEYVKYRMQNATRRDVLLAQQHAVKAKLSKYKEHPKNFKSFKDASSGMNAKARLNASLKHIESLLNTKDADWLDSTFDAWYNHKVLVEKTDGKAENAIYEYNNQELYDYFLEEIENAGYNLDMLAIMRPDLKAKNLIPSSKKPTEFTLASTGTPLRPEKVTPAGYIYNTTSAYAVKMDLEKLLEQLKNDSGFEALDVSAFPSDAFHVDPQTNANMLEDLDTTGFLSTVISKLYTQIDKSTYLPVEVQDTLSSLVELLVDVRSIYQQPDYYNYNLGKLEHVLGLASDLFQTYEYDYVIRHLNEFAELHAVLQNYRIELRQTSPKLGVLQGPYDFNGTTQWYNGSQQIDVPTEIVGTVDGTVPIQDFRDFVASFGRAADGYIDIESLRDYYPSLPPHVADCVEEAIHTASLLKPKDYPKFYEAFKELYNEVALFEQRMSREAAVFYSGAEVPGINTFDPDFRYDFSELPDFASNFYAKLANCRQSFQALEYKTVMKSKYDAMESLSKQLPEFVAAQKHFSTPDAELESIEFKWAVDEYNRTFSIQNSTWVNATAFSGISEQSSKIGLSIAPNNVLESVYSGAVLSDKAPNKVLVSELENNRIEYWFHSFEDIYNSEQLKIDNNVATLMQKRSRVVSLKAKKSSEIEELKKQLVVAEAEYKESLKTQASEKTDIKDVNTSTKEVLDPFGVIKLNESSKEGEALLQDPEIKESLEAYESMLAEFKNTLPASNYDDLLVFLGTYNKLLSEKDLHHFRSNKSLDYTHLEGSYKAFEARYSASLATSENYLKHIVQDYPEYQDLFYYLDDIYTRVESLRIDTYDITRGYTVDVLGSHTGRKDFKAPKENLFTARSAEYERISKALEEAEAEEARLLERIKALDSEFAAENSKRIPFKVNVATDSLQRKHIVKFINNVDRLVNKSLKSVAILSDLSTDCATALYKIKEYASQLEITSEFYFLSALEVPVSAKERFAAVKTIYDMVFKTQDIEHAAKLNEFLGQLQSVDSSYRDVVQAAGLDGLRVDGTFSVSLKEALEGNFDNILYTNFGSKKSNIGMPSWQVLRIRDPFSIRANAEYVRQWGQTYDTWATRFTSDTTSSRDYAQKTLGDSISEILFTLDDLATNDPAQLRIVDEYLSDAMDQIRKARDTQILDTVTQSMDNLVTHLAYHNQILILPKGSSDELYRTYYAKLKNMLTDESCPDFIIRREDTKFTYIGFARDTNIYHKADEGIMLSYGGKEYGKLLKESDLGYEHIKIPSFIDLGYHEKLDADQMFNLYESLTVPLERCYKQLDFLSDGHIKGSIGLPHTAERHRALWKSLPSGFRRAALQESTTCDSMLFSSSHFDMSLLGSTDECYKVGTWDSTDILQNLNKCYEDLAGSTSTTKMYISNYFDNNCSSRIGNVFKGVSKEEQLQILRENPDQCVLVLRESNSYSGFSVKKLNIRNEATLDAAYIENAIVVPYDIYVEMTRVINESSINKSYLKVWARLVFFLKVGHLCNPGTWMRNWVDATIKATNEVGSFGDTARGQLNAMRLLSDYNKLVKQVKTASGDYNKSLSAIQANWKAYQTASKTSMTYDEFMFLESWLKVSLSGGESRLYSNILKRQANDPFSTRNLKKGNTDSFFNRNKAQDSFDLVGDGLRRFEDLGIDEIEQLISKCKESGRKKYELFTDEFTEEMFWEIFENRVKDSSYYVENAKYPMYVNVVNTILTKRNTLWDRSPKGVSTQIDHLCSMCLSPMSKIEQVVRLGQYLALEEKGYTKSQIFKSIADSQFEYELKSARIKNLELLMTYANFEFMNMKYWLNQLETNPSFIYTLGRMWGSLSWEPCRSYTDNEDYYNNQSIAYMMQTGAVPIGNKGLYLKMFPSALGALNWFCGLPSQYMQAVVPPLETLTKELSYLTGGWFASVVNNVDYSYQDQTVWEKLLANVPIAGTVYTRYIQHAQRKPWMRLEDAPKSQFLAKWNPTVWGAANLYNDADDFEAFQEKLALQGKWYDCNLCRVVDLSHKNTYALNDPNLSFEDRKKYMFIYKHKLWDMNWSGFKDNGKGLEKDYGHFTSMGDRYYDDDGTVMPVGLNRRFDFDQEGEWEDFNRLEWLYHGRKWDNNTRKFISGDLWKKEGLNRDNLTWYEFNYYLNINGYYYDMETRTVKKLKDGEKWHLNQFNHGYYSRGWHEFKRWVRHGNRPPADRRKYNGNFVQSGGKTFNKPFSSSGNYSALRMATSGYKSYDEYYNFEFKYNYSYRRPFPRNTVKRYNPAIRNRLYT